MVRGKAVARRKTDVGLLTEKQAGRTEGQQMRWTAAERRCTRRKESEGRKPDRDRVARQLAPIPAFCCARPRRSSTHHLRFH